jgi:hypothetical protein
MRSALLRVGLRREEGAISMLSRYLFLIPVSRDSETYRAIIGRPARRGTGGRIVSGIPENFKKHFFVKTP